MTEVRDTAGIVLVTGAAGFIGRHVARALSDAQWRVIGLDVTPMPRAAQADQDDPTFRGWITADITKPLAKIEGLDAVIHLAAVAAPRDCDKDPSRAFDINVNGTLQVLRMALESGAKKVVFSSTAHVYDIPPRYMPTDETHPLRLNNTYTTTKILGEQLCHLFWENHGLPYTVLRLFNAYGPGQSQGYFIPDMLAKSQSFTLPGGNTTKDFVWIEDVARAFVLAMESPYVGPLNIGTGIETPLSDIAYTIATRHGLDCISSDVPNATRMRADIKRAKRVIGWEPTKTVEEGLRVICDASKVAVR